LTDPDALDPATRQALAREAATWLKQVSGATLCLALVGTSGADEGVFGRTPGETWLGVADDETVATVHITFGGQDEFTHVRIGNQVLATLHRWLVMRNA